MQTITLLCWLVTSVVCIQSALAWRTFYISPSNTDSVNCPAEHCYSLQDVINNQADFFDSYTTLELMPGRYDITEKVGQLIIDRVKHFLMKQFVVGQNVTFYCDSNATFGLTVIGSYNVTISGLQIIHCSAALMHMTLIERMTAPQYRHIVVFPIYRYFKQWLMNPVSCDADHAGLPCIATIVFINNSDVSMLQTTILYSQQIGLFTFKNNFMFIDGSLMAYNNVNCIIYYLSTSTEMFDQIIPMDLTEELVNNSVISDSHFLFGQATNVSHSLASGLNLLVLVHGRADGHETIIDFNPYLRIRVQHTSFVNNKGQYGNFFSGVFISVPLIRIHNFMFFTNLSVISDDNFPGLVIHEYDPYQANQKSYRLYHIEKCIFVGSCVVILGKPTDGYHHFITVGMAINQSRCPVAMNVTDIRKLFLENSNISNSHGNILQTTDGDLKFQGILYFYRNQGTFSVIGGKVTFDKLSNVVFDKNSAVQQYSYDSVLYCDTAEIFLLGSATFSNNRGKKGGAIAAYGSVLHFGKNSTTTFFGNSADNGGAMCLNDKSLIRNIDNATIAHGSLLLFAENSATIFVGNSADNGGAIRLNDNSFINIDNATRIYFRENKAKYYGGGVFVEDKSLWIERTSQKTCFVQLNKNGTGYLHFANNEAGLAGNALFGGWIDVCLRKGINYTVSDVFSFNDIKSLAEISSNPSRVCICDFVPNRCQDSKNISLFPGQSFTMKVMAVGQMFGRVVSAIVRAEVYYRQYDIIDDLQKWQDVRMQCTQLQYTISSPNQEETMLLTVDDHEQYVPMPSRIPFKVNIHLKKCSLGFIFDSKLNICVCHYLLLHQKIECNTTSHTIHRTTNLWITANAYSEILIHHRCPLDYCVPHDLSLNLSTSDDQCANNHSGILCGKCQPGLSQVLGSSNCKKCSSLWIFLLLPFALAGVALVVCLMVLNFTVSTGTINGLIFYANIIRANSAIFFPGQSANTFLSWFIAWLNLDLGVETCFYNGLTAYIETWLQFAFPIYIWLLVIIIIISGRSSVRVARVCRMQNSVQVLATLFFLSYAKLLRVTITIFQPAHLIILANNTKDMVWNYDGNIGYLQGRHIPLFMTALLFFVLFLIPYTFILAGVQVLQRFSHHKPFFWVNKFKPLLDAYTGPYKDKHRYWTGFLLFVRIILFLLIYTDTSGNSALQLLGITLVVIFLFVYLAFVGGVYKTWPLNLLEYSFFSNLAVLSAGTLYCFTTGSNSLVITQTSVSIVFISTVFITLYHCQLRDKYLKRKIFSFYEKFILNRVKRADNDLNTENDPFSRNNITTPSQVTYSVVELEEPLI